MNKFSIKKKYFNLEKLLFLFPKILKTFLLLNKNQFKSAKQNFSILKKELKKPYNKQINKLFFVIFWSNNNFY